MDDKQEPTQQQQLSTATSDRLISSGPLIPHRVSDNPFGDYEAAINKLCSDLPQPSAEGVLAALVARDEVNRFVATGAALDVADLDQLARLDGQLKKAATKIDSALGGEKLSQWKRIMDPASERWWWSLDNTELHPRVTLIVTIMLGVSFCFTGDTVGQLLKVAAISASVAAVLIHAFLTFLTGSALTESGRRWAMEALRGLGFGQFRAINVVLVASSVLVLSFMGRWFLPSAVGAYYFHEGEAYASKKDWVQAIGSYNRALTLTPGNQNIHYKLAIAYDNSFQFDRAIDEYKSLITDGTGDPSVFNNLARIYIIQKTEDPALRLLERLNGQLRGLNSDEIYPVFKNRGWFKLGLNQYEDARSDLLTALTARPDGLAAHYLLGLALEGLDHRDEALGEYRNAIKIYAQNPEEAADVEPGWMRHAQSKVIQGAKKK